MAEIDAAISKLISELKKLQGEEAAGTGIARGGIGVQPTAEESEEVRKIQEQINALYDDRERKKS